MIEQPELGQRVKFCHILNRVYKTRQDMGRWREGVVVGLRTVCKAERRDPLPPKTTPDRVVVLVAVSLYRHYLVEHEDLFEDNGHGSNRTTTKF